MLSILIFLIVIVAANLSVAHFGKTFPPIMVINAFILIGLDLSLRDHIHEKWHNENLGFKMFCLICVGAAITYILNRNAGMICLASVIAFAAALSVDAILYQHFYAKPKFIKMNYSNIGSAATDSFLFPTIAFGIFMPWIILAQFFAKVFGGAAWAYFLSKPNKKPSKKLTAKQLELTIPENGHGLSEKGT